MGQARHLRVLLRDSLRGVNQNQAHVRALDGHSGPEDAVLFNGLLHLALPPEARRVDEDEFALVVFKPGVDSVPGGARHVGDNHPLLPQDFVHQGGLSRVGLSDNRHLDGVVLLFLPVLRREVLEAGVQQVPGAVSVDGGDGDGVPQPQVIELIEIRVRGPGGVHLVHRQDDGLPAAQQHGGHLLVRGGEACPNIRQKDNHRGGLDGGLGLVPHELQNLAVRPGLDAAGVHQGEGPAAPVGLPVDAVPGDAGGVLHDGQAFSDDLIEQHGLAHVGAAHDGDDRL